MIGVNAKLKTGNFYLYYYIYICVRGEIFMIWFFCSKVKSLSKFNLILYSEISAKFRMLVYRYTVNLNNFQYEFIFSIKFVKTVFGYTNVSNR